MASRVLTFRVSDEDLEKLDYLLLVTRTPSRSALLLSWIRTEYDRVNGNPKMQELLSQLNSVRDVFEHFAGTLPALDPSVTCEDPMPAGMEASRN